MNLFVTFLQSAQHRQAFRKRAYRRRLSQIHPIPVIAGLAALIVARADSSNGFPMALPPVNTSAAAQTAPNVEVWLTLPNQSKLLNHETPLSFTPTAPAPAGTYVINVNPTQQYQVMEGFGAAMTDSSAYLIMRSLTETQRETVMRNLFTREGDGIGISYVRVPIAASDFSLRDHSYDDMPRGETDPQLEHFSVNYDEAYILPALQAAQALNPSLRFMGSPWSAPGWMKSNGQFHGGSLLPEYYPAFANYLIRFVQAYAERGVTIDTLTPQNEPLHTINTYPTMELSAEGEAELIRDYLGPGLEQAGLSTRILIFDHNWNQYEYPLTFLSDSAAAAYVDGVAFHCYGGSVSSQSIVHDRYPDFGIWFTECSGGDWSQNFAGNLSWNIRNLGINNFRNWGNSMLLWNLALDEFAGPQNGGCEDCRGVLTIDHQGQVTYNVEYYILGHFSRFVDPGAVRIDSTAYIEGQPENVAFRNPDGSIVLVVHSTRVTQFTVNTPDGQFSYSLPAAAVVSFKWGGSQSSQ